MTSIMNRGIGGFLDKRVAQLNEQERWDKDFSLRKAADARAQATENRAQSEFDRLNKERENVLLATSVLADLQPHLLSKDTSPVMQGMDNVMQQGILPKGGGYAGGSVSVPIGTTKVPYTYKEQVQASNAPVDVQFKYNVNTTPYKERKDSSLLQRQVAPIQQELDSLLDTKGMYTTRPASSVRDLSPEGKARQAELQTQLKDVMRDKSVPQTRETLLSSFGNLDLGTALTRDGKPAGKDVPFNQQYVLDKANNKLVSMNTATAVAQKQQQGIDMASVPQYVEKTGYKEVPIKSDRIMSKFTTKGYAPAEVQQAMGNVQGQYMKLMEMLPKDNSARREEYKQYANMIVGNLGIDPRSFDVNAYVDKIMPKTEMSDAQKEAFRTAVHAVDVKLDQFNKDRTFNLQKWEAEASMAIRNAELSIRRSESANKTDNTKITMFKKTADGVQTVEVPASQLDTAINQGFQLGKFGYAPQGTKTSDGKSEISLTELGGRSWLGGTSGADLEAYANRKKAQYPKVPMSAIKAEIASQVGGNYFTDSVNDAVMDKILKGYSK